MIKFIETFDFDEGSKNHQTYIVTELAHLTFDKYFTKKYDKYSLKKKDDSERMNYFCQMVEGLKVLHSKHSIHRDLKPENFLVTF